MKIFVLPYKSIWGVKSEAEESFLSLNSSRSKAIEKAKDFIFEETDEVVIFNASGEISEILR
jgi:hypothetical protein